ncbi:hypothetical protein PHMEG_00014248 [Phytophthora megakarya]|uniref:M96 mating-specific protein n=1 Tax=Phytophthora megakarya TaxID=4795 RepID=A0A225W4E9_9STRA|nr:hypothetical protein PHMEG_00014248 [Phytophthora megakarya]
MPSNVSVDQGGKPVKPSNISLWKHAAMRQLERRREVEEKNVKLKEMLEMQVQEAKCLQRILKRRRKIQMMEDMLGVKNRITPPTIDDSQIFAQMLRHIENMFTIVEIYFAKKGFNSLPCPGQKRKVSKNVITGVFYEQMQKSLLPFEIHSSERALWKVLTENATERSKHGSMVEFHEHHVKKSHNTVASSYFFSTRGDAEICGVQVQKVTRKFVKDDKVVFVCNMLAEPLIKSTFLSVGYQLNATLQVVMERGWPSISADDTTQLSIHFDVMCQDLVIPGSGKSLSRGHVDICVTMWGNLIPGLHSEIESMLIDEGANSIPTEFAVFS